jgi:hypothetical protein
LRSAIGCFREQYGEDKTVGVESVVLTDYQSSEYSCEEGGVLTEDQWIAARNGAGFVVNALEIRGKSWRSLRVSSQ